MRPARALLAMVAWGISLAAWGDEVDICYNYGCATHATVNFRGAQLAQIRPLFATSPDPAAERTAIATAIGLFETMAGEQTPTFRDKGGNAADDGEDGRMDCIDHSHNTTAYLQLLEDHGWLKHHRVLAPVKRAPVVVNEHWAAQILETQTLERYAVDSWFFDNGRPAAIFTLEDWLKGAHPDE